MDEQTLIQKQKELDEEYVKYGLTDDIIDKQIELNKLRNEHNINTTAELNDDGFVQ